MQLFQCFAPADRTRDPFRLRAYTGGPFARQCDRSVQARPRPNPGASRSLQASTEFDAEDGQPSPAARYELAGSAVTSVLVQPCLRAGADYRQTHPRRAATSYLPPTSLTMTAKLLTPDICVIGAGAGGLVGRGRRGGVRRAGRSGRAEQDGRRMPQLRLRAVEGAARCGATICGPEELTGVRHRIGRCGRSTLPRCARTCAT